MSKLIVITSVTGTQGSSIAETFLRFPEWRVRGTTRNPASVTAQVLAEKGVDIVQADFDDKTSLSSAFQGANVIYSNTDFFVHLFTGISEGAPPGRTILEHAYDREVAQGINIAEAAASPSVLETLEYFIYSSLSDATKWSKGKYTMVYHFDSKAETIRQIESRFPELAARMSTLQMGYYVTNWKAFPPMAPQKQTDGSFLFERPLSPDSIVEFVVTQKDTGGFVKALIEMPPGKNLIGVSERMTWKEWTKIWGDVLGVKAAFKQVFEETFWKGVPEAMRELQLAWEYVDEFGHAGGDPDVLRPEELPSKIALTSMEEYIKSEDWSAVLNS
ncbi:putative NmrA-like protein [Botrytis fragariae]|uniref:Putative NmrA-like protein n=1 Tax=Botrytis fragariae TaxID=1964551 RepID=A0A8H6AIY4_9HELO|nr:putative NmrA-like protein [Botrytis fragariae]KAF5868219.1 putative NmrA-like protein [Botrytis fragariae]